MDRQQFYRGDAERFDVFYHLIGKSLIGTAPFFRQSRMKPGKAAQMELVNDRMLPRDAATARFALPVEIRVDDDAFGHIGRAVTFVECRIVAGLKLIAEDSGI